MPLTKKCRHGRGKAGQARLRAWRRCGCTWYADLYIEGRRCHVRLGPDQEKARVDYARLVADRESGRLKPMAASPAIGELADRWLEQARADGLRPGTLASYRSHREVLVAWFGLFPVERIRPELLTEFDEDLRGHYSKAYAREIWNSLTAVLRLAEIEGVIDRAPIPPRRRQRGDAAPRVERMTLAEAEATIAALPESVRPMGELALLTGLRRGELLGLRGRDVDLDLGRIAVVGQVTRHGEGPVKAAASDRIVGLTPRACEVIAERMPADPGERLFPLTPRVAADRLVEAMKDAGTYKARRGWHSFRHAHTALLNRSGVSLRDAAQHLGHGANLPQTLQYGWAAEVNRDAVAALDAARGR